MGVELTPPPESAWSQEKPIFTHASSVGLDLCKYCTDEELEEKLLAHILLPGRRIFCAGPALTAPPVGGYEGIAHAKALWQLAAYLVWPEFRG